MKTVLREFLQEGWIVAFIGGILMTLRIAIEKEKETLKTQIKKIFVASFSCAIAFFLLEHAGIGDFAKAITYGIIGVTSPEIIEGVVKYAKKFSKSPEHFIHLEKEEKEHKD